MKRSYVIACLLVGTLGACAPAATEDLSGEGSEGIELEPGDVAVDQAQVRTLADVLVRLPGINMVGRGGRPEALYRGRVPAYAIDGLIIAYSYAEAANAVVVQDIARVDIVSPIEATSLYGARGSNGVIAISTRQGR